MKRKPTSRTNRRAEFTALVAEYRTYSTEQLVERFVEVRRRQARAHVNLMAAELLLRERDAGSLSHPDDSMPS